VSVDIAHWIFGHLSGAERIWSAAGPALLLCAYFAVGAVAYAGRYLRRGSFRDEEMDARGKGGLTTPGLRHFFAWTMRPWWTLLARVRFPPNAITSLSMAVAAGAGIGVAAGRFSLGGWLFVTAGALDFLDGRVARGSGQVTQSGAALDSILDRYVESAFIVGLAWYYRHDWVLVVCLLALTGSLLVPYVRARGESLGVAMKDVGWMQRPERVLVLGAGTALSPIVEVIVDPHNPHPNHWLSIVALVLLAALSHGTALQRVASLLATLDGRRRPKLRVAKPLKSVLSNALATAVDLAVATSVLRAFETHPSSATAIGCAVGAVVSFSLSRAWAFEAGGAVMPQLGRYVFVSASGAALNAGGVALLSMLEAPFLLAWSLTRVAVFASWSYPVQRDFVFAAVTGHPMAFPPQGPAVPAASEPPSRPGLPNTSALGGRG
jgi:phosphatidylglycerophosphate synthase/putative flippase GtrA